MVAMSTVNIEWNTLYVKQSDCIQVKGITQVPPYAIWLQQQGTIMFSPLNRAYRDDISGFNDENSLMTMASILYGLHWILISLFNGHHTSSLMGRPCCKHLNQDKEPVNTWFSMLNNEKTVQPCENASSGWPKVAIHAYPYWENHCIISWYPKLSPPCGPSAMNYVNFLLITWKRCHQKCYCVVPTVFCIVETTEILIVIPVVCEVGKSFETPSDVVL